MKWGEIADEVWTVQNDSSEASELRPISKRVNEEQAEATEMDQWTINRMYELLESAARNAQAAADKLKPHVTSEETYDENNG